MAERAGKLICAGRELPLGSRTLIMGVVNVTPDSFSDGGRWLDPATAIARGQELADQGAEILDIGGESTRPGSDAVSLQEELARVLPVIKGLAKTTQALISIDTYRAPVAQAALEAGAVIINDITALRGDPAMAPLAARTGAAVVLMHMQGTPKTMQVNPHYDDVVAEVKEFLRQRAESALAAGISPQSIVLDPGIGFGKTMEHNLALIRHLGALKQLGYPVLLAASNKAFIGLLTGRPAGERLWGTMGAHVAGALLGADMVRVHEAAPLKEALAVCDAIARG